MGIRVDLREVTSDEYRATGNNNELEILTWKNDGISAPAFSQDPRAVYPPFGDFFNPGPGIAWSQWRNTGGEQGGEQGGEPPADMARLWDLADALIQQPLGTPESDAIGTEIMEIHLDNMIRIGAVGDIVEPFLFHNTLQNVKPLTSTTYDCYWVYPYRPQQWFLSE